MKIVVGHLYPDYLNIYADRGNMAVLSRRAAWRGHELEVRQISVGDPLEPGDHDLLYVGGGQDREQALVAQDLVAKADGVRESVSAGATLLAVCGGYQLLGRSYRDLHGADLPGIGVFPFDTVAGDTRMIGDVLLECELEPGLLRTLAGFENHAGRTMTARAVGRVAASDVPWGRTSTGHSCLGIPGSPTGCSRRRSRIATARRRSWSPWPTSSKPKPMQFRLAEPKPEAAVAAERRAPTQRVGIEPATLTASLALEVLRECDRTAPKLDQGAHRAPR